jgi:hypothetical protein
MTISDQELFCDFYLWERIFVDSQINHKFVNPQICERGEIWECSSISTIFDLVGRADGGNGGTIGPSKYQNALY